MKLARVGLGLSVAAALAADYPWGDFTGHTHWWNVRWLPFISPPLRWWDILQNILLFLPMGVFMRAVSRSPARAIWGAAALGLAVALLGEWSQVYSHGRIPSMTDVVCNVAGAVVGASVVMRRDRFDE